MRRLLVLGASGFIGQAVLAEALAQGVETVGYSTARADLRTAGGVRDVSSQLDEHTTLVVSVRAPQRENPWRTFEDDVDIADAVGAMLSHRRLRQCVYVSSLSVYGDTLTNLAITELTPPAPSSPYGASKLVAERILERAAARSGTPMLVLRPCMLYGPGDRSLAYGPSLLARSASESGAISLFGDGEELRPYLYIDDAASIIMRLIAAGHCGVINLASGVSCSFQQIATILAELSGPGLGMTTRPRTRSRTDLAVNPERLESALGAITFTGLDEGLAKTWRGLRSSSNLGVGHG